MSSQVQEKVGTLTSEEVETIKKIHERRNSLAELFNVIDPSNNALYEKLVADMSETKSKYDQWWSETSAKYQWKGAGDPNLSWNLDFMTGDVYLVSRD